jgi:hypothetical protein
MTEPHINQSPEVIEAIFTRELVPALDAHRLPIERVWETVNSTEQGLLFSAPADENLPAVRINATKQEFNFSVDGDGPFQIATAAILRVIEERKRPE